MKDHPHSQSAGKIIPLTPKASPLEDNPNTWQAHTSAMPVFKMKRPIEIEYDDRTRRVFRSPEHITESEARTIRFWRWHQELEKMPFFIKFVWHRHFTFKDRLRIFFGKNIVVPIAVACRHSPGNCQPVAIGYVTKSKDAEEYMANELKQATERYLKEGAQEV